MVYQAWKPALDLGTKIAFMTRSNIIKMEYIMNNPKIVDATASSTLPTQEEYFAKRQLKQGAVGWLLLVGLGVAYVISGDFAGWNFGLAQGGWGGMFIATVVVAVMYLCMCLYVRNGHHVAYRRRRLQFCPYRIRTFWRISDRYCYSD